jgi:hypothetical protein
MSKLVLHFSGPASAKRFVARVKELPFVTYATDYSRGGSKSDVMVCGELDGKEDEIKKLKRY